MSKHQWILDGLAKPGKTRVGLAKALNRQPSMVTELLNGPRELKASEIPKIVEYLGVMPPALAGVVKIVGQSGFAADGLIRFAPGQASYGETPMPPGGTKDTVAVEFVDNQLRSIAKNGWLLYYDDIRQLPQPAMLGELCVVGLADDRVVIKYLHPGREGLFDLESASEPTQRDVKVVWASLVTAIIPAPHAQSIIRRAAPQVGAKAKPKRGRK